MGGQPMDGLPQVAEDVNDQRSFRSAVAESRTDDGRFLQKGNHLKEADEGRRREPEGGPKALPRRAGIALEIETDPPRKYDDGTDGALQVVHCGHLVPVEERQ